MKQFLIKFSAFFLLTSLGLIVAYRILDPGYTTIGDVRHIKTRNIISKNEVYNTLLIGSSRVYDVGNLSDCNYLIYNYGFIQAIPEDFPAFIEYALENQPIQKIIIGLDFFGTSNKGLNDASSHWKKSDEYINEVKSENLLSRTLSIYDFQRFKRLVNYKILKNDPFERSSQPLDVKSNNYWNRPFWNIYKNAYATYSFNENLGITYKEIKKVCKNSEIIVYITPESEILFKLLLDMKLESDYQKFLRVATENFDTVINMMEINEFTKSPKNFKDESHLTVKNLHNIICGLANGSMVDIPATILTKQNIETYLKEEKYKSR